jgi:choice-of-anchor B domain-containing protein
VWGYTAPDGSEYTLMGVYEGVAVVRVPDMQVIGVTPGPNDFGTCYYHRDIKTYQHYAYVTSEMHGLNEGVMIIDLQYLPDSVHFVKSYIHGSQIVSHNLYIDTDSGFAYILTSGNFQVRIVSLADPENPVDVGQIPTQKSHDVYVRNDTAYVSEGSQNRYSIWDVSNKTSPRFLNRILPASFGYAHNLWLSEDGNIAVTTEETIGHTVKIWDVSNPASDISFLGEYLGANQLAHNAHVKGNFVFISHYSYGISVVNISNPAQPVEVAHYDTFAENDAPGFWGCWGAYPFTKDGYVYAGDTNGYLTVLKFVESPTGTGEILPGAAGEFELAQNYPNPFNPSTTIQFNLPESGRSRLVIFNSAGQAVRTLVDANLNAGSHSVTWDGRANSGNPLPAGNYFYRLVFSGKRHFEVTRRMVLVK